MKKRPVALQHIDTRVIAVRGPFNGDLKTIAWGGRSLSPWDPRRHTQSSAANHAKIHSCKLLGLIAFNRTSMQIKQILFREQHLSSLVLREELTIKQRAEFLMQAQSGGLRSSLPQESLLVPCNDYLGFISALMELGTTSSL